MREGGCGVVGKEGGRGVVREEGERCGEECRVCREGG